MKFRTSKHQPFASGYPATDFVAARRMRVKGSALNLTEEVILSNGTNAFSINLGSYKKVAVVPGDGGAFKIVGHESLEDDSQVRVLAMFGNERAASNGYAALMRTRYGIKIAPSGSKFKWAASMVALFAAVLLVMPTEQSAATLSVQQTQVPQQAMAAAVTGRFNPQEQTLEELAAGNYQFRPQLKTPDIVVPDLNCAPAN